MVRHFINDISWLYVLYNDGSNDISDFNNTNGIDQLNTLYSDGIIKQSFIEVEILYKIVTITYIYIVRLLVLKL